MSFKNQFILIIFCLLVFISMSSVCASDSDNITINDNREFPVCDIGSFDELNTDIQNLHPGDIYEVNKNYYFDKTNIPYHDRVIEIACDNVTINGNGHIIDAGGVSKSFSIFKVTGNNVKISNLTFVYSHPNGDIVVSEDSPSYYKFQESPVSWYGDGGVLTNCNFQDNTATNGGAVSWKANNGVIEDCQFINNTANGVGGAIYICGENNTLSNLNFINCRSELSGEAIYFDRNRKNIKFNNLTANENAILFIDGKAVDIDVNYLYYTYLMNVGGKCTYKGYMVDIIPQIYKCLIYGAATDEYHTYYCNYINETGDFTLNIHTNYGNFNEYLKGLEYLNELHFNIAGFNDIYTQLFSRDFKEFSTEIATVFVNNYDDYKSIFTKEMYIPTLEALCENHTRALNVVLAKNLFIQSTYCFNVKELGYDIINVEGNGSTIQAVTGSRDEFRWAITAEGYIFTASNIQVEGFNQAILNHGTCILKNVKLHNNRMDYWFERDWGAAILNTGYVLCTNCSFTNNYAKNGGAIFNQGILELNNVIFENNEAYGEGNDVCVGDGGIVRIDGRDISLETSKNIELMADINNNDENASVIMPYVYFAESMSVGTSALISGFGIALAAIAGLVAGSLTCNPVVGVAVGLAVGALVGGATAGIIISQHYDVNYNRMKTALTLTIEGAMGGAIAGGVSAYMNSLIDFYRNGLVHFENTDTTSLISYGISTGITVVFGGIGGLSGYLIEG